jgi:hypothetical protein
MAVGWKFTVRCSTSRCMSSVSLPEESGAGCAHLNSSGIHESVQVQTAQKHSGPGFQEVLPSTFSQSLLKKSSLLSGNNCSITDIRRGPGLALRSADSYAGSLRCRNLGLRAPHLGWMQLCPTRIAASAETGCRRRQVVHRPLSEPLEPENLKNRMATAPTPHCESRIPLETNLDDGIV